MTFGASGLSWTRVRLPRRLSTAYKIIYALTGFAGVATRLGTYNTAVVVITAVIGIASLAGWGLIVASYILSLTESWYSGNVDITETELVVRAIGKGARIVKRSDIVGALIVPRAIGNGWIVSTVEVELRDGDRLTVRLNDPEAAQAFATQLGFGPGRGRVHTRLAKPSRRVIHLPVAFLLYILLLVPMTAASVFFMAPYQDNSTSVANVAAVLGMGSLQAVQVLFYTFITRFMRPAEAVIGDDGVSVRRGRRSKFYRANDPELPAALSGLNVDEMRRNAVLHEAMNRSVGAPRVEPSLFARAGRSMADWRRHLASAMDPSGYRASPKTADDAAAVLRDVAATPDERVGAALALRVAGEPAERVRIAAEATADDPMRSALEAIAEGADDVVVERALARASTPR